MLGPNQCFTRGCFVNLICLQEIPDGNSHKKMEHFFLIHLDLKGLYKVFSFQFVDIRIYNKTQKVSNDSGKYFRSFSQNGVLKIDDQHY